LKERIKSNYWCEGDAAAAAAAAATMCEQRASWQNKTTELTRQIVGRGLRCSGWQAST